MAEPVLFLPKARYTAKESTKEETIMGFVQKLRELVFDLRFSLHYDAEQMAEKNKKTYGDNVPDCCRMNRQKQAADQKTAGQ